MKKEIVEKRRIGVNFENDGTATILLWAPLALSAEIEIQGRSLLALNVAEYGYWDLQTNELRPGDQYLIKLDNKNLFPDPASLHQPNGVHNSSVALDLNNYQWHDQEWKGIIKDELIIYEIHIGTFTPEGTFDAAVNRSKYLKELGIKAIELMPVSQFPGTRNWGYDGVYPFAVQNSYGGPDALKQLVDAFHRENIAVILDVVYNHLGPEGNYLPNFGHYFTGKYRTPWGDAINFDDEWCDGVRRYYIENALMWMRDFHIDGLRLDAIHAIKDFGAKHFLEELKEYVNELNKGSAINHFLIGESDLNDVRFINPRERGGYDLDHQWADDFHHSLHALVTSEKNGYYSDFGSITFLEKSFNDVFVYDGLYSPYRKKTFGNKTIGQPKEKFIVFTQNHDQIGNRMNGDRLSTLVNFEMLKLIAGTLFISPYIPMIFMGEEYGETNPFRYFTSHGDEELIHLVREGRKSEFKDFFSEEAFHDPQSEETFNDSKITLSDDFRGEKAFMLSFYIELIRLKKQHPVIKNSRRENMATTSLEMSNILLHTKTSEEHFIAAIMNFENQFCHIDLNGWKENTIHVLLNSSESKWGGSDTVYSGNADNLSTILLKKYIEPSFIDSDKTSKFFIKAAPESIVILSDVVV